MTPIVSGMLCESDFTLITDPIILVNYWANYKKKGFFEDNIWGSVLCKITVVETYLD